VHMVSSCGDNMSASVKTTVKKEGTTVDPQVRKLMQDLVNECIALTLTLATTDCNCDVCKEARKIAKIVKKLYRFRR